MFHSIRWGRQGVIVLWLITSCLTSSVAQASEKLQYNRDIRPILAENCFACHGPDSASRKADLRLDRREVAIERQAVVPGKPDESGLIDRIFSEEPTELMPPPKTKKQLTADQKELLRRWITEGAEYQLHWSYIAPVRSRLPDVKNATWVRNPIDRFILARLEAIGLTPAPPSDRHTLARRLSLDLTGLPPSPELVESFAADRSPDAYEKLVDRLLDSKQWGEHRARYWLDAARYADTNGLHFDNFREIWTYRDWVINAFNRNKPFDQFTVEQLAGDLMPGHSLEQEIATGFNRCNITTNEGGTIPEENLVHYTRDRTETVAAVWLGTTANCATCHDHKFDPLTQREFYEMAAFFNNTTQGAMDGNIKDTPPIVVVPKSDDRQRWTDLQSEIPAAKQRIEARKTEARGAFEQWLAAATPEIVGGTVPQNELLLHAPLSDGEGKSAKITVGDEVRQVALADSAKWQPGLPSMQALEVQGAACELADVGDFERDQAFTCAAWLKLPAAESSGAICSRMDNASGYRGWDFWVQRRQVGSHIVNAWPNDALKVVGKAQIAANQWTHVVLTYDGSAKAAGVRIYYDGKPQETLVEADRLQAESTTKTAVPFKIGQRNTSEPLTGSIQDLRIYKRVLTPGEVESLAKATRFAGIFAKPADQRTDSDKNEIYPWWLASFDQSFQELSAGAAGLEREQSTIKSRGSIAHVMTERTEPPMAFVLFRGEYDKRRDQVQADTPDVFPPMPPELPKNRLGFAQWLIRPEHPLTARVTVNRFWQEVFGTGLVKTAGDFGVAGELPSNPELLDWLAVEFRESGWDVKQFFKLLVMSATYQQAATTTPDKLERDPQNRLLSRGPRYRMDAEMVRDYVLSASGLLVPKIGGPSVKPYQPDGVWEAVAMIGSNTRDYKRDAGESLYRRSMYTLWKRAAPPASMEILNAPSREFCTVRRERTNTPLQALLTLNDPQFVEAARHLAESAIKQSPSNDARADFIAHRVLCRPVTPEERKIIDESLRELIGYYSGRDDDAMRLLVVGESKPDAAIAPAELAAWTMLANELLNLDEVLNK